ncbi:MAG: sodium:solute symporter family transporter [Aminobacterium colombiense]
MYKGKAVDGKKMLRVSRMTTGAVAAVALLAAYVVPSKLINTVVGYAWAGIGSTFSVVILGALFSKRFNSKAAFATMVTGVFFTIIWNIMGYEKTIISARAMTFFVCCAVAVVVSLLTEPDVKE